MTLLLLLAFGVNIPLGYLRAGVQKLSWRWFAYVHLSIPLIATCRLLSGYGWVVAPLLIAAAIVGQLLGGWARPQAG